jgi:uncharacterized membrane protein YgcG
VQILWGNIAVDAIELKEATDKGAKIIEGCGRSDNGCEEYCKTGDNQNCDTGANVFFIREYTANAKAKPPADAACSFSVFLLLLQLGQIFLIKQMQAEGIAGGGESAGIYSGGADSGGKSGGEGGGSSEDTSGDGYQRL